MKKIKFTKMVASGNDFIVIEKNYQLPITNYQLLAKNICDRKYGVGADGLLVLEKAKIADIRMRIFNADGSEAEMCGNGARCIALYAKRCMLNAKKSVKIKTKAGVIESQVNGSDVKIKLTDPGDIRLDIPIKINNRTLKVNFINTGVPHAIIFVEGLDKIDVVNLGRQIRYHRKFMPRGTNVDFVEIINNKSIKVRTYERGVEAETLACGTGAVAAALVTSYQLPVTSSGKMNVHTRSGEILKVYFNRIKDRFQKVWLEGRARIVCKGVYYV